MSRLQVVWGEDASPEWDLVPCAALSPTPGPLISSVASVPSPRLSPAPPSVLTGVPEGKYFKDHEMLKHWSQICTQWREAASGGLICKEVSHLGNGSLPWHHLLPTKNKQNQAKLQEEYNFGITVCLIFPGWNCKNKKSVDAKLIHYNLLFSMKQ